MKRLLLAAFFILTALAWAPSAHAVCDGLRPPGYTGTQDCQYKGTLDFKAALLSSGNQTLTTSTFDPNKGKFVKCSTGGAAVTLTTPVTANLLYYVLVTSSSNDCTLDPVGGGQINGSSTLVLSTANTLGTIWCDGTNCFAQSSTAITAVDSSGIVDGSIANVDLGPYMPKTVCFVYSFAVDGGTQAAHTLANCTDGTTAQTLPSKAVIARVTREMDIALTSGGSATVIVGTTNNTNGIITSTAYDHASFAINIATNETGELPYQITGGSAESVKLTIAGADLTAGKIKFYVTYFQGD